MEFYEKICTKVGAPELFETYKEDFLQSIEDSKELTRVRNKSQEREKELTKAEERDKNFWSKVKVGLGTATTGGLFWYFTAAAAVVAAPVATAVAAPLATAVAVGAPAVATATLITVDEAILVGKILLTVGRWYLGMPYIPVF